MPTTLQWLARVELALLAARTVHLATEAFWARSRAAALRGFNRQVNHLQHMRTGEIVAMTMGMMEPLMDGGATLEGLRTGSGQRLIEQSLVAGLAQRLLQRQAIS